MSTGPGGAAQRVNGPAIGLMVTGGLGVFCQIVNLVMILGFAGAAAALDQGDGAFKQIQALFQGTLGIISAIIGLLIGGVILFGAMKMKNLESFGLAMASSILAMIPFISPCCILGLPVGIWAVVVLNNPEVRSAFR